MTYESAYGLWSLVVINSLIFIIFAFSFSKPQTKRDWRSFSAFSAFIVALFVEMYGFPLTIYLISGWVLKRYPNLDLFSHDAGHLWNTLLGWDINPHFDPLHILSNVLIFGGFILLSAAWKVRYEAQKTHTLATTGHLCLRASSAIRGLYSYHARIFVSVAHADHLVDVSYSGDDVRQARAPGGKRSGGGVR